MKDARTAGYYPVSLSSRTIVYKGMVLVTQLRDYYLDLQDERFESAIALVHQRFATNTFPTWQLAHPYRMVAHNGEINTLRGNVNWMAARQASVDSELFGNDISKLWPISYEGQSDTACFDNALEFLVRGGYSLSHAMMMLIPEAWAGNPLMNDDRRAFYEYHAALMEPWDGPAAVCFTDGKQIGATLDRNGLRPARYLVTDDGLVVLASEMGVLPIPEEKIVEKWRLQPGKMLLIDLEEGRIVSDDEIKQQLSNAHPYKEWLKRTQIVLEDLKPVQARESRTDVSLLDRQQAFGYTPEDLKLLMQPMAVTGQEAVGSMGSDTPISALSDKSKLLYTYFKQNFAQVTNPPIDPIREELVMSLVSFIGPRPNILDLEGTSRRKRLEVRQPILTNEDLEKIRCIGHFEDRFDTKTLDITYDAELGASALDGALDRLCDRAEAAVHGGYNIIILTDRMVGPDRIPIPALLATAAVHNYLIRKGLRTSVGLVVEIRRAARDPSLRLPCRLRRGSDQSLSRLRDHRSDARGGRAAGRSGRGRGDQALHQVHRQGPAQGDVQDGHLDLPILLRRADLRCGRPQVRVRDPRLLRHGDHHRRHRHGRDRGGERAPSPRRLRRRADLPQRARCRRRIRLSPARRGACLEPGHGRDAAACGAPQRAGSLPRVRAARERAGQRAQDHPRPLPHQESPRKPAARPSTLDEVEPAQEIVKRFSTGAMSFGSISKEAHETLALAMNSIGGKSNTGEGGEEPERFRVLPNGTSKRSAIKQVASGRFGVTTEYLVNADMMQIKVAQGAKPGEGGQLPGHKVDAKIARVRHSTPGVGLISPPPHHDIYSIEDLAQLIFDLKNVNPAADVSVKLVSEVGVGTVAAGVAKARADHITISGFEGGTGASPLTSIKHAGSPWEIGLAETQQTLVLNRLRGRVALQADGGLRTGRDVVIAALLGADEFGFSTAPLIAAGCIMMRKCHLNTCPVGVATQDPVLRKRFKGLPEHVVNYFFFVAEEVRELMAAMGFRTIDEMIGQSRPPRQERGHRPLEGQGPRLHAHLPQAGGGPEASRSVIGSVRSHPIANVLDRELIAKAAAALEHGKPVTIEAKVATSDRTVGAMLSGEVAKRYGHEGLPDDTITVKLKGTAGQSFGAWLAAGVTLDARGRGQRLCRQGPVRRQADHPPAGRLEGARRALDRRRQHGDLRRHRGRSYFRGVAGERFAVRNSGAIAVVEGTGDHGCEYMTGGIVVVIGQTGRNFAAGMSGGIAYVLDEDGTFTKRCNLSMVDLEPVQRRRT